jgi:hypothetical protein
MKKFLTLGLVLMLISFAASAQNDNGKQLPPQGQHVSPYKNRFRDGGSRFEMRRRRFGIMNPIERRRIHRMKCRERRELMMRRHRRVNRVI